VPDAAFVIAGEGDLMPGLRSLAAQLGIERDVFFIGRCENVGQLLFACDIGVLSSKAEGFANAILEYLAAGLPVVATDVGGVREAIAEGETGYVVSSGDDEKMAAGIVRLLNDPERARAMGQLGRSMVAATFSCDHHLQNTLELYAELLNARETAAAGVSELFATHEES
jgi:glycosyltransferase involved in cell wall biosynthesis